MSTYQMPDRDRLRDEYDRAIREIDQRREPAMLTTKFYSAVGDSLFDAAWGALEDSFAAQSDEPPAAIDRLHVVSAPAGSGKTSFSIALAAAMVRLGTEENTLPLSCLFVVDQKTRADELYREIVALVGAEAVAVWTSDHDLKRPKPNSRTKVRNPATSHHVYDLAGRSIAIVTHSFYGGSRADKAKLVHENGQLVSRSLTIVDEQPSQVSVYQTTLAGAEKVREIMQDLALNASCSRLRNMTTLTSFMRDRESSEMPLEKPSDAPEAWDIDLSWFAGNEARDFSEGFADESAVTQVFGFARALASGYGFIIRKKNTHFIGYEANLLRSPGMVLLDATADLDGVTQLCPWRKHQAVPKATYEKLDIVHVPAPRALKGNLSRQFKELKNRKLYMAWVEQVIQSQMAPGQKGLVVCKKTLMDNEHVPAEAWEAPDHDEDSKFLWKMSDKDGTRNLAAIHWGAGIGRNVWKEADVVFLFDEFYIPLRTTIATAQGLGGHRTTEGPLAAMTALNTKSDDISGLKEGHLLRWNKQMGLRGKARQFDGEGACSAQKLVCTGSLERLTANADRLFPGARITMSPLEDTKAKVAERLYAILGALNAADLIPTKFISEQLGMPWREVLKNTLSKPKVLKSIENFGYTYVVVGKGRGSKSFFQRTTSMVDTAIAA